MNAPTPSVSSALEALGLDSPYHAPIEALADWFGSLDALKAAVLADGDKLEDALFETADSEVSVYTSDRFEWAASHPREVSEYESDALCCTSSIEEAIAFCWQKAERAALRDATEALRSALALDAAAS